MTLTLVRRFDTAPASDDAAVEPAADLQQAVTELVPLASADFHGEADVQAPQTVVTCGLVGRLRSAGSDLGMTTAEYAIGTVAACGFGGVLIKLLTSDTVVKLLSDLIRKALTLAF